MWTELRLELHYLLGEPEILWTMKGNYSDELINGMIIAAYMVLIGSDWESNFLNYYTFEGYHDNEYVYDPYDEIYNEHISDQDANTHRYIVQVVGSTGEVLIFGFNTPEWLQGFISMCNAMEVDYHDYLGNIIIDVETDQAYSVEI